MTIYNVLNRPLTVAASLIMMLAFVLPLPVAAQNVALDKGENLFDKRTGWLPYMFSTDSLGTGFGVGGYTAAGRLQPQASLFGTAFVTSNNSALISGALNNYRLGNSRFFTDIFLLADHFTDQRFYADLDLDPSEHKAGSNDSDKDDFISGVSNEVTFEYTLKYSLPIGNAKEDPISIYHLDRGFLQTGPQGGSEWNPFTSGKTTLATRFFYTYRDLDDFGEDEDQLQAKTNGLDFWIEYDNTDFPRNPTYGSRQQFKVSSDFGWFDSSNSWTNLELDMSKYFNLGTSGWFNQQVLALNFWTSNTPTWKTDPDNPQQVTHRPPPNYGSELGGFDRMRAYPSGRFRDKSAVYYAAELRLIPKYQPLHDLPIIRYFEIDWWQIVPFVEAGRVGPDYNSDLFTRDLKWGAGLGLRIMAYRSVFRLDFATSDEGSSVWAMISQPFSRPGN